MRLERILSMLGKKNYIEKRKAKTKIAKMNIVFEFNTQTKQKLNF